jgi:hypothetical protein
MRSFCVECEGLCAGHNNASASLANVKLMRRNGERKQLPSVTPVLSTNQSTGRRRGSASGIKKKRDIDIDGTAGETNAAAGRRRRVTSSNGLLPVGSGSQTEGLGLNVSGLPSARSAASRVGGGVEGLVVPSDLAALSANLSEMLNGVYAMAMRDLQASIAR